MSEVLIGGQVFGEGYMAPGSADEWNTESPARCTPPPGGQSCLLAGSIEEKSFQLEPFLFFWLAANILWKDDYVVEISDF